MTATLAAAEVLDPPAGQVGCQEFMHRARITFRRLDYWTRTGLLTASENTPGSGYHRTWPASEIPVAALIAQLSDHGLEPRAGEPIARALLATGHSTFAGLRLDLTQDL